MLRASNKDKKEKHSVFQDELVKGGFILFIMINIFNFLNYLFHFIMSRLLGPIDYGTLAVLFSFMYIFSIPTEAIQNIVTSFTSRLSHQKANPKLKYFLKRSLKKSLLFSFVLLLLFVPIALILSPFLKIDFFLLLYTGSLLFLLTSIPIFRGALQGKKKFFSLGLNMIVEGIFKLALGMLLVCLGFKIYGAMTSLLISFALSLLTAYILMRKIFKEKEEPIAFNGIYSYSLPYFITLSALVLMYSIDIILAKYFFSPDIAGKYAVASMLGKMIFFGSFAVGKTMFPLATEKFENGEATNALLRKSIKIIAAACSIILILFYFFPELIIRILFGSQYLDVSEILIYVGLAFSFLSFTNIFLLYGLSTKKLGKSSSLSILMITAIEIFLFFMFHNSLLEFSFAFMLSGLISFIYCYILIKFIKRKNEAQHNNPCA